MDAGYNHKEIDAKTQAAYLIGQISWAFALNLGAMHLAGRGLPDIDPDHIALAQEWYRWEDGEESGEALRFRIRLLAPPDLPFHPLGSEGIRALIIAAHAPLIDQLCALTKLGRNALWRLVADSVAAGWLSVGKKIGQDRRAMDSSTEILQSPGSPLTNKQTGFVEIVVRADHMSDAIVGREWFRARGGCCRYYTTAESQGEYCSTCVLRSAESRDERLHDYLRDKIAAETADIPAH